MRHLRIAGGRLQLLSNETTEQAQSLLSLRLREHLPETPEPQRRTRRRRLKRVLAGRGDMVLLLE
jgi:hypothetical protein